LACHVVPANAGIHGLGADKHPVSQLAEPFCALRPRVPAFAGRTTVERLGSCFFCIFCGIQIGTGGPFSSRGHRTRAACASRARFEPIARPRSRPPRQPCPHISPQAIVRSQAASRPRQNGRDPRQARRPLAIQAFGHALERVLTTLAFQIVSNLLGRRLANVDEGRPGEVIGPDSTHRSSPRLKRSGRSR